MEDQAHERVIHLEKVAAELVGPVRHEIWDVHCTSSRWWVVTNPMNLYDQADFKSRDVVLTFHIGLMLRVEYAREREVPIRPSSETLLPGSWRRWQQAFEAYESGDEAESFQAVGVRLRECLLSFIAETCDDALATAGKTPPKGSDFRGWSDLLAGRLATGESAARLRSYLKKMAAETWEYVNWLTHAKNIAPLEESADTMLARWRAAGISVARKTESPIGTSRVCFAIGKSLIARLTAAATKLGRTVSKLPDQLHSGMRCHGPEIASSARMIWRRRWVR